MEDGFGILQAIEQKQNFCMGSRWISSLPKFLYYRYIRWKLPMLWDEVWMQNVLLGYKIKIPILQEDLIHPTRIVKEILYQIAEELKKENIRILDTQFPQHFEEFIIADGRHLNLFFLMKWIRKLAKTYGLDLRTLSVGMIDGENKETDLVIDIIYPYLNFLSVYTPRLGYFMEKSEEIFEDVGLNLQISDTPKPVLSNADLVIYFGDEKEIPICFKRDAIFLNLSQNKNLTLEISERRPDVIIVEDASYSYDKEHYTSIFMELYAYVKHPSYQAYIKEERYDFEVCREFFDAFHEMQISVHELYCFGRMVKTRQLFSKVAK